MFAHPPTRLGRPSALAIGLRPSPRRGLRPLHPLRALPGTLAGLGPSPRRGFRPLNPLGLRPAAWRGVWSLHPSRALPGTLVGLGPSPGGGFASLRPLGLCPAAWRGVWSLHPFRALPGTLVGLGPSLRRGFRPCTPAGLRPLNPLGLRPAAWREVWSLHPFRALPGTLAGLRPSPGGGFAPCTPAGLRPRALSGCARHPGGGFSPAPPRAVPGTLVGFATCTHSRGLTEARSALPPTPPSSCALLGPAGAPPLRDLGLRSASRWEFQPLDPFAGLSRNPRGASFPAAFLLASGMRRARHRSVSAGRALGPRGGFLRPRLRRPARGLVPRAHPVAVGRKGGRAASSRSGEAALRAGQASVGVSARRP
ncbi:hypothetical protein SUDANB174_02937 [Streptomyces sp. enrichment culture]